LTLFFSSGSEFNTIKALVKVVWVDVHLAEDLGNYRAGVMFVDISLGHRKINHFLEESFRIAKPKLEMK